MDSMLLDYSVKYCKERDLDLQETILRGLIGFNTANYPKVVPPLGMNIYIKDAEGKIAGGHDRNDMDAMAAH
jgi:hypothetical protein